MDNGVKGFLFAFLFIFIVITSFFGVGMYTYDISPLEIKPESFDIAQDKLNGNVMIQYPIEESTRPDQVSGLVSNLTEDCNESETKWQKYCEKKEVESFMLSNISYNDSTGDTPTPKKVLERGHARCVGKAILYSSMMRELGYETQYAMQEVENSTADHICVIYTSYTSGKQKKTWGCNSGDFYAIL